MQKTNSSIHFTDQNGLLVALVLAAQPTGIEGKADLITFFEDMETQTPNTRYDDPQQLAVKFCVWQALRTAQTPTKPLDFLGIGVGIIEPKGVTHRYTVRAGDTNSARPSVQYEQA